MERLLKYIAITFVALFIIMVIGVFSSDLRVGFWGWTAFVFFGTIFISLGAFIGALIRDFIMPDIYMTSGAVDAFEKRIFWAIGPQTIGAIIGVIVCNNFLGNVLGLTQFLG